MHSFFEKKYQTPAWYQAKFARRQLLKSAAGATAIAALPSWSLTNTDKATLATASQTDPWLTLHAVLLHLFPASESGPSADDIQALAYLYQVVTVQPTVPEEKTFILQGVTWLNNYSQTQHKQAFVTLTHYQKENLLRAISQSEAGDNWLSTLLNYLFEALLAPPIYGGNPKGIGWTWLAHQPGFPLPNKGGRYYEIPGRYRISVNNINSTTNNSSERKETRKS